MKPLADLKAMNLPKATSAEMFKTEPDAEVDKYLANFIAPGSDKCIGCGDTLMFRWDMVHGEGFCPNRSCQYPCRVYHRNVGSREFFERLLQYHPDVLQENAA